MTMIAWHGISGSASQTMRVGEIVAGVAIGGDVIALIGELGAGKTQFVRGLARGMGMEPREVSSPTFVLMHEHEPTNDTSPALVHIDAYRIGSAGELQTIGWDGPGGGELREDAVVVVEWADRLGDAVGDDLLEIRLSHLDDSHRAIQIIPRGVWAGRMDALELALNREMTP